MQNDTIRKIVLGSLFGLAFVVTVAVHKFPVVCPACSDSISSKNPVLRCFPKTGPGTTYCAVSKTLDIVDGNVAKIFEFVRDDLLDTLKDIPPTLRQMIIQVYDQVQQFSRLMLKEADEVRRMVLSSITGFLAQAFKAAKQTAVDLYNQVLKPAVQYITRYLIEPLKQLIQRMLEVKEVIRATIADMIGQTGQYTRESIEAILSSVDLAFQVVPESLNVAMQELVDTINQMNQTTISSINMSTSKIFDSTQNTINEAMSATEDMINSANHGAEDAVNDMLDGMEYSMNQVIQQANRGIGGLNKALDEFVAAFNTLVGGWNKMRDFKLNKKFAGIRVNFGRPLSFLPKMKELGIGSGSSSNPIMLEPIGDPDPEPKPPYTANPVLVLPPSPLGTAGVPAYREGKGGNIVSDLPFELKVDYVDGFCFKFPGLPAVKKNKDYSMMLVRVNHRSMIVDEVACFTEEQITAGLNIEYNPFSEWLVMGYRDAETHECKIAVVLDGDVLEKAGIDGVKMVVHPREYKLKPLFSVDKSNKLVYFSHGSVHAVSPTGVMRVVYDPASNFPVQIKTGADAYEQPEGFEYVYFVDVHNDVFQTDPLGAMKKAKALGAVVPEIPAIRLPDVNFPSVNGLLPRVDLTQQKEASQIPSNSTTVPAPKIPANTITIKEPVMNGLETVVDRLRSVYQSMLAPIRDAIASVTMLVTEVYHNFTAFLKEYASISKIAQILPGDCFEQATVEQIQAGIDFLMTEDESVLDNTPEPKISWSVLLRCLASDIYGSIIALFKQYVIPPLHQFVSMAWDNIKTLYTTVKSIVVQALIKVGQILKTAFIFIKDQAVMVAKKTVEVSTSIYLHYMQKFADYTLRFIPSQTARINILMLAALLVMVFIVFGPHTDLFVRKMKGLPISIRTGILGTAGAAWLAFSSVQLVKKYREKKKRGTR